MSDVSGVSPPTPPTHCCHLCGEQIEYGAHAHGCEHHEPTTLRSIHERCKERHATYKHRDALRDPWCKGCGDSWPCADYSDAVAALALLHAALQVAIVGSGSGSTTEDWRCVYDPDPPPPPEAGNNT